MNNTTKCKECMLAFLSEEEVLKLWKEITRRKERDLLQKKFEKQLTTLKKLNCPQIILDILLKQRDTVLDKAIKMSISEKNISFIPVIPKGYISIYSQLQMANINTNLTEADEFLFNQDLGSQKPPNKPYYIFNIRKKKSSILSRDTAPETLTIYEGIALCIHTNTLINDGEINCCKTQYMYQRSMLQIKNIIEATPELICLRNEKMEENMLYHYR